MSLRESMTGYRNAVWLALCLGVIAPGVGCALGRALVRASECARCEVRFELALDKVAYQVGEPIVLKIRIHNVGSEPVEMSTSPEVTGRLDGFTFVVTDVDGKRIPDFPWEFAGSFLGGSYSLKPNKVDVRELFLNYRVAPLRPGRYAVAGSFASTQNHIQAKSNRLSFEIVPTSSAQLQSRVTDLMRDVARGKREEQVAPLLGFTGTRAR
jgi:hypothetical protein